MSDLFLMSPPGPAWKLRGRANFRSAAAEPVDARRARQEWLALARGIERAGGVVAVLPPEDEALTGLPYAAEAGHPLPALTGGKPRFLLPRMWAEHRRGERERWAPFAERLGFETVDVGAGIWEGQGDVATFDSTTLLFFGGRTDRTGLGAAMQHFDGEVIVLELRQPAFHGNMAVLPLPVVDKLLACPDVIVGDGIDRLLDRFGRDRVVPVSEDEIRSYATNGLPVGGTWLAPSVAPERVQTLVRGFGMQVELLEMQELCEKAGGASRCLVCVAPGAGQAVTIAPEHRLDATAEAIRADAS